MRIAALLLDRDAALRAGERELPDPAPGQALLRVEWAGLSEHDLRLLRAPGQAAHWPATPGHEIAAVVEACPGGEFAPGTPVVADSRIPCGSCPGCALPAPRCERPARIGAAVPGGHASRLLLPVGSLVPCPPGLEPAIAVLAEPLAVAAHAASRVTADPGRAVILGYGPPGALLHAQLASRFPACEVTVAEPDPDRRALARALGACSPLEIPEGERWPLVVDAAGFAGSLRRSIELTAPGGQILLAAPGHRAETLVPATIAERGLTLSGGTDPGGELPAAVAILAADADRYRPLITEALLLSEAPARLAELAAAPPLTAAPPSAPRAVGKVLIRP